MCINFRRHLLYFYNTDFFAPIFPTSSIVLVNTMQSLMTWYFHEGSSEDFRSENQMNNINRQQLQCCKKAQETESDAHRVLFETKPLSRKIGRFGRGGGRISDTAIHGEKLVAVISSHFLSLFRGFVEFRHDNVFGALFLRQTLCHKKRDQIVELQPKFYYVFF